MTRIVSHSGRYSQFCAETERFVNTATPRLFVAENESGARSFERRMSIANAQDAAVGSAADSSTRTPSLTLSAK